MNVLVTGSDGYIGSVLVPMLRDRGHTVRKIDTGYYRDGWLQGPAGQADERWSAAPPYLSDDGITKDIRRIEPDDFDGIEAVVHLGELSNDPLGEHSAATTYAINYGGSTRLAAWSKECGVRRFVYASSCSVYGAQEASTLKTERSLLDPQTAYARCKALVERDVAAMADSHFSPTFLRNATAYGPSPRMRFDIVLNNLAGLAWTSREIALTSDGSPWRPLVHVRDICHAVICTLEAPRSAIHNEVFNVGHTAENYRVRQIAQMVVDALPGCRLRAGAPDPDNRSYRVSCDKIARKLPGFECTYSLRQGAEELMEFFDAVHLTKATFEFRAYTRLKQLKHLLVTGQLDKHFHWTPNTIPAGLPLWKAHT